MTASTPGSLLWLTATSPVGLRLNDASATLMSAVYQLMLAMSTISALYLTPPASDDAEQAAATERAKVALEAEYERRMETLEDTYAAKRKQVQTDADVELESVIARERSKLQREAEGELEGLRDDLQEAQRRATEAEAAVVGLWRQLLPADQRTYLYDAGVVELDLTTLNPILQRASQVAIAHMAKADSVG
jgi:hypothetical protein